MKKISIYPSKIKGVVKVSGSKNASLPIIAASLVSGHEVILKNIPKITDVLDLFSILRKIGCFCDLKKKKIIIKPCCNDEFLLYEEIKKFRASYYLMSVYLALFNKVRIYSPGGCSIGARPINFHLEGFSKAGCEIVRDDEIIEIKAEKLQPFTYEIPKKSLGATVNLTILASKIEGKTILKNVSMEPEIDDLISFINKGSAKVYRQGDCLVIFGSKTFVKKIKHKVIPDRIESFTFMCIGLCSKKLKVKNINLSHLKEPLKSLLISGANIKKKKSSVVVRKSKLQPFDVVSGDYPMISTDQMPLLYPLACWINGVSIFKEGIFENRFQVCHELKKVNKEIEIYEDIVKIRGGNNINGAVFNATDLRCAASLLIEGIFNQSSTIINLHYLERGYENIYYKLSKIGLRYDVF